MAFDNIASIQASSISLPEVKKLSAASITQLSKFNGQKLLLNDIESLSKREAQAFKSFTEELQLKGLKELKPAVLLNSSLDDIEYMFTSTSYNLHT